jgi:hypothetical protein
LLAGPNLYYERLGTKMNTLMTWTYVLIAVGFYTSIEDNPDAFIKSALWPYTAGVIIGDQMKTSDYN